MASASADLTWLLVRNNNSFLIKNKSDDGVVFSSEANNLKNLSSFKYSGLAADKTVGITKAERGANFRLVLCGRRLHRTLTKNQSPFVNCGCSIKVAGKSAKPAKANAVQHLTKDNRHASISVANALVKGHYRPDLKKASAFSCVFWMALSDRRFAFFSLLGCPRQALGPPAQAHQEVRCQARPPRHPVKLVFFYSLCWVV